LAFPALSLAAYSMNLSGKVVDAGGQGVAQVEVALKGTEYKATTDASGAWVLQQESAALRGPTLSAVRALGEGQGAYSVSGRRMGDTRQLAQGVYVQKSVQNVIRNQALAKEAGEKDSLIVSYQGAEVGRLEQADLLQGALPDMMFLTVSPTLTQGTDNSALASQFRLLGQSVLVNYAYDASLWRPSILTVGATKITLTDPSQKLFKVALGVQEDAAVNLALVTRLQTITVPDIAGHTYGDAAFDVNATASSGLSVTIVSTTLTVCSVVNGQVNLLSAGSCALKATQAGNADYNAVEIALKDFTISKKTLTASADDKVYDGSTAAALSLTGIVGSDEVTGNGIFASATAGTVIAVTDLALAGAQKDNYTLGTVTSLSANISKKTLTASADDKVYDGTPAAALTLTGILGSDEVTGNGVFASANAGTGIAVTDLVLSGAHQDNYTLGSVTSLTADITKKTLTASADDKVYDGTPAATLALTGKVGNDAVTGSGVFASATAGSGIAVTDLVLSGAYQDNYTLGSVTSLTASIAKKTLTASANDKVYDGTPAAALTLTGQVGSDEVTGSGTFATAQAGLDKVVTNLALAGAHQDNYTLGAVTSLTADITKKTVTVAAKTGANLSKVYDGTNVATLVKDTHYELTGVLGVDVVDITVTGAIYNSANVAAAATATATFSDALMGANAGNYQIVAGSFNMAATITQATLAFSSANPGSLLLASSPVTHTFSTNGNAGVTLASSTPAVCEYVSGSLTLTAAGLCSITATPIDAGNFTNGAQAQSFGVDRLYDERDGGLYKIVKIGNQVWMAENLNVGTWVNGTAFGTNQANDAIIEKYCYSDAETNCTTDGGLYQWAEAMGFKSQCNSVLLSDATCASSIASGHHQGICPTGWHIPKSADWNTLATQLGGPSVAGQKMKLNATGYTNWDASTYNNGNSSGFSALPAGVRTSGGGFASRGTVAFFWEASEYNVSGAYRRGLVLAGLDMANNGKASGFSVRCVRD